MWTNPILFSQRPDSIDLQSKRTDRIRVNIVKALGEPCFDHIEKPAIDFRMESADFVLSSGSGVTNITMLSKC